MSNHGIVETHAAFQTHAERTYPVTSADGSVNKHVRQAGFSVLEVLFRVRVAAH
jgi:hypothetical protein